MKLKNALLAIGILTLLGCQGYKSEFPTQSFVFALDGKGKITQLNDREGAFNYATNDDLNALMAIRLDNQLTYPTSAQHDKESGLVQLYYSPHDIVATIQITPKENYLTLELIELTNKAQVELVLWGPYQTTIKETVGETIGVVRNKDFAIGIQALNPRTLGGYPINEDDSTPSFNIFSTTSLVDIADSLDILYRGHTAMPREYGSSLQAYTRNRLKERLVAALGHKKYTAPSYNDEGVVGSKIALFGCHPDKVLELIEAIELNEKLPHPTLNGVWSKRAISATAAYLIMYFDTETIDEAINLTQKAGLKYLYHGGPFHNWGAFDLQEKAFPKNWESMRWCVDKAEQNGIKVGLHTLSNFVTTNDPYVTPVPDERLAKVGSSELVHSIDAQQKNIEIADPTFFNEMEENNLHAVLIGKELIRYEAVSKDKPWTLLNCERGAFGTAASTHNNGEKISKLIDHTYKTFLTNIELSIEMSDKIADKIDPSELLLNSGNHKIKVDCKFSGGNDQASLKLELKTAGPSEEVALF